MGKFCFLACLLLGMPLSAFAQGDTAGASQAATLLSSYIQLASVSGSEKEAGVFFSGLCKSMGLHVNVFSAKEDSHNFSASLYPLESRKPNIILLNHIDVVPVAGNWQYAPFSGTIAGGMVWGRGAVDNKGMAIMQLLAVADLVELASTRELPYNVTILSVSSEEAGGALGAKTVAENHLDALNAVLVLGEGGAGVSGILASDPEKKVFGIEISQKSGLRLKLSVKVASSGHGAVPPEAYANKKMVAALDRLLNRRADIRVSAPAELMFEALGKHERGLRGFAMRHPWLMGLFGGRALREEPLIHALVTNTATVTNISNPPTSPNQIPQRVTATLDCRLLPGTTQQGFIRGLKRTLRDKNIAVEVLSSSRPALYTAPDTLFFKALCQAVTQVYPDALVVPILFPASNDNSYFRARGIPAYGLLPLYLRDELLRAIHNQNERVPVSSLDTGIAVYRHFLVRMLMGNLPGKDLPAQP